MKGFEFEKIDHSVGLIENFFEKSQKNLKTKNTKIKKP